MQQNALLVVGFTLFLIGIVGEIATYILQKSFSLGFIVIAIIGGVFVAIENMAPIYKDR